MSPGYVRLAVKAVRSTLTIINVLYFLGGCLVLGALSLFMTLGWGTLPASSFMFATLLAPVQRHSVAREFSASRQSTSLELGCLRSSSGSKRRNE